MISATPKPKRGRPTKALGETREVFAVRLSKAERSRILAIAEAAGKTASGWARDAILAACSAAVKQEDPVTRER